MKGLLGRIKRERGLTLLELAVVGAILGILAGLTATAVTGQSTAAQGAALVNDKAEVQKAVENYTGQHPRGDHPTLTGCWPGTVKSADLGCTSLGAAPAAPWPSDPVPSAISAWLSNKNNWTAVVWDKAYLRDGKVSVFGKDFLGKLPRHATEHMDGSKWSRTVVDPERVVTAGLFVPNCAGHEDAGGACTATFVAPNTPVWLLDRDGVVRVTIGETAY